MLYVLVHLQRMVVAARSAGLLSGHERFACLPARIESTGGPAEIRHEMFR